jgi:ankyrin repeat protein
MKTKCIKIADFLSNVGTTTSGTNANLASFTAEEQVEIGRFIEKYWSDGTAADEHGQTALHFAVGDDYSIAVIKYLVSQGADVNAKNGNEQTPLYLANNIEIVKFLISQGADVHAKTDRGETPLHLTAWRDTGAKVDGTIDEELETADMKMIKWFVERGADVNAKRDDGATPLHLAAWTRRSTEFLKCLIMLGADVNAKDNNGETPLDWAMRWKKEIRYKDNAWVIAYLESIGAKSGKDVPPNFRPSSQP